MKYIKKTETPQFFIDDTKELKKWNEYFSYDKKKLKEHILKNEQNYLCGYCEAKVTMENSHIEHIKPKSLDEESLTFDYNNLLVSCNGICYSKDNTPETCGHKKGEEFSENLFLNPVKKENIREYFKYSENGKIDSSGFDDPKAIYTIDLLKLNSFNNNLLEARKKALTEFRKVVEKYASQTGRDLKQIAKILLNKENLAFISFLRYRYKNLLTESN